MINTKRASTTSEVCSQSCDIVLPCTVQSAGAAHLAPFQQLGMRIRLQKTGVAAPTIERCAGQLGRGGVCSRAGYTLDALVVEGRV